MSALRIDMLGKFNVLQGDGFRPHFRLNKSKALLAYLAAHPDEPVSRICLANLLWSDRYDKQARRSLRQALSMLKKALEEMGISALVTTSTDVMLDTSDLQIDVSKFVALSGQNDAASLNTAVTLYEGDFLDGFDVASPVFDDWVVEKRRLLRDMVISTLTKLSEFKVSGGQPELAIASAERLTILDPFAEEAHRALMCLYVENGQSGKALRQFELCRDHLKRELDVPPETETLALASRIRADRSADFSTRELISSEPVEILPAVESIREIPAEFSNDTAILSVFPTQNSLRRVVLAGVLATTLGLFAFNGQLRFGDKISPINFGTSALSQGTNPLTLNPPNFSASSSAERANLADELSEDINGRERELTSGHVSLNTHAINAYLNGQQSFREQSPEGLSRALEYYELALEFDPSFAKAEAALANALLQVYLNNWHHLAGLPMSGDAFNMAVERAENLLRRDNPPALAHTILAKALYFGPVRPVRYDEAITQAHRAIAFDPDDSQAFLGLGEILVHSGAPEQAISHFEMARKLDPGNAGMAAYGLALAYLHIERFEKAYDQIEIALKASPNAYTMWALAAIIRGHLGQIGTAQLAFTQAIVLGRKQGQSADSSIWPVGAEYYRRDADFNRLVTGIRLVCGPERFRI